MTTGKAETLSGLTGAGAFLLAFLALSWPLWVGLVIAVVLYAGVNLALGGSVENRVRQVFGSGEMIAQLAARVEQDRKEIKDLRRLARFVRELGIRDRILAVCDIAEKIIDNFAEDPEDLKQAQRFVIQFEKLLPIVENYVHLSSDSDRRAVLTEQDQADLRETLDAYVENLRQAYQAYQENNLQKLRMATGVLKRMVDLDGIGKKR
jgi:5-bromo-4-chloroindolyl phosphate hydrolysis protein